MTRVALTLLFAVMACAIWAQQPLSYYLPDISYNDKVPTPESVLGYQVGEWHASHDLQYLYMRTLAASSSRIKLVEHGRTHERRPLIHLIITSEKNHQNLDNLKAQHKLLCDPQQSAGLNLDNLPIVLYQGFSIHGNEPSGGNAAMLVAYYLAAGQSKELDELLEKAVIILDPCFNPDGFQRFSVWANSRRNKNLTADPQDSEYNEPWPRGRTNHYWFDLNRDWLPAQHPESQARLRVFHDWKPNLLTDHHEMGTQSTFFFMPGEPQRVHPITPAKNQELTDKIAQYHASALNKIGSLYYTREGFDDFYYGKGSTYPDANGGVGILFEQGSSRGHVQETDNGLLTFAFTIRNQVTTALSTQKAAMALKNEMLQYQRDFYQSAMEEARRDDRKAYVFGDADDKVRAAFFVELLQRHQIDVYKLQKSVEANGQVFQPGSAYVVPLEQNQYKLTKAIFETMTSFQDSQFYDISSWTVPLAFNLPYGAIDRRNWSPGLMGMKAIRDEVAPATTMPQASNYAYVMDWSDYNAPKALNFLLKKGIRAKVSNQPFATQNRSYKRGAILIPVANQSVEPAALEALIGMAVYDNKVRIYAEDGGLTPEGSDFGSSSFQTIKAPKTLLIIGEGVSSYDAGEVWHLLDQRFAMEVVKGEANQLGSMDLDKYNNIILPDGNYGAISQGGVEKLKRWIQEGGTLIAMQSAVRWVKDKGLASIELRTEKQDAAADKKTRRPYEKQSDDAGAQVIGGSIFETKADLTHPLFYGYSNDKIPVFRQGTLMFEPAKNPYATPALYTSQPLLSGYISNKNLKALSQSAAVIVGSTGRGKVICLADNPCFRAYWFGGSKLMANCLFFGAVIDNAATERAGE